MIKEIKDFVSSLEIREQNVLSKETLLNKREEEVTARELTMSIMSLMKQ